MSHSSLTAVARHLLFVHEVGGPNAGAWVSFIQRFTGNRPGDSWCASFVCMVLDIAFHGLSPLTRSARCQTLLDQARRRGWVVPSPQVDDLFFYLNTVDHAHHIGIVTTVLPDGTVIGIAGNTSEDGTSSNGTGVFEHAVKADVFVRLPKEIA